ncbi:MAG: hypothetical protein A3C90_00840 [Candidatus Magasanikbacteria bacterium RIFCSPHIGHO2_02_FULL_51_14]|uniref:Uncharacterized protein n=1 Tax=Candidatus Magasanikbacteria bacterium RIFCSPHIGHO2_02_FULL_51_14 TaxID=1798683 RepID=A0A1F6MEB0_9BACT|nr:MAG: hypothetical protein A3C90_00840 [Candidatus Magasanikbacteria bacterium RIFCSPHIGHO2_02_FULL_51_14]
MATAHLLLGKIAEKRAEGDRHNPTHFSVDIEEARRHYRAALNVEGSAHQVRAVAKRLLDRLSTPSASSGDPTDTSNTGETDPSHSPD